LLSHYLPFHESYDFFDVIIEPILQLLMMAAALIGGPFMQLFGESVEDDSFPPLLLGAEILAEFLEKL
jgi:hypothetical protein